MTRVVRLNGAPGVGKTTRLFEYVAEEQSDGLSLGELYYATFTRTAREESKSRLAELYPGAERKDIKKAAKTFHGVACSTAIHEGIIEDVTEQIIQQSTDTDVYQRFCQRHGLTFDPHASNPMRPGDSTDSGLPSGNALFATNDYLTSIHRGPEYHKFAPADLPWGHDETVTLLEAWEHFKQAGRAESGLPLYEHGDYVDKCINRDLAPAARVMFVDEFQDLSPQEYLLFKTWRDSGALDRVYIAGDPNQSIYAFRGAQARYFQETDVDENHTLKKSYRCPSSVASVASAILDSCSDTDPQGFHADSDGGVVRYESFGDDTLASAVASAALEHDGDGADVFLLSRTNHQVRSLAKALQRAGVPFQWLGSRTGAWNKDMGYILSALRALRAGRNVSGSATKRLLAKSSGKRQKLFAEAAGYSATSGVANAPRDVMAAYPDVDSPERIVGLLELAEWRRDLLQNALGRATGLDPSRVRIGTIHAAKGLEAPCVFLFAGSTPTVLDAYRNGEQAEEHRLYYVGATRASEELVVSRYFDTEPFPPLKGGVPGRKGVIA